VDDPQLLANLGWRFFNLVFALGIMPAAGGAILWKTFQIAGTPYFTYGRCWKAYLGGCGWAWLLFTGLSMAFGRLDGIEAIQVGIFFVTTLLVVPLMLWNFTGRVLAAEGIALAVIDLSVLVFVFVSRLQ
jgi:hypothetical protein